MSIFYRSTADRIVDALYSIEERKNEDVVKHTDGSFVEIRRGRILRHPIMAPIEFRIVTADALPEISEMTYCESTEVSFSVISWKSKDRYNRKSGRYLGSEITYSAFGRVPFTNFEHRGLPNLTELEVLEAQR